MRIIAGRWRGRPIATPPGSATRPTSDRVREAWMSAIQFDLPGSRVVELFAGSGALGLEALSRGADHATFVETSSPALAALEKNIATLEAADHTTVIRRDAIEYAESLSDHAFDIALADPPYGRGMAAGLVSVFVERRFADWLWIEHGSDEPLPEHAGARTRRYGDTSITSIPAPT